MCQKCKDDRCEGFYLLHPKELNNRYKIIKKELDENPNRKFLLIDSPSSGEVFTRFYELHVLDNVGEGEAGRLVDKRYGSTSEIDVRPFINVASVTVEISNMSGSINGSVIKIL